MTASGLMLDIAGVVQKVNDGASCDWCHHPIHVLQHVEYICRGGNEEFIIVHARPDGTCWHDLVDDLFNQVGR